MRKQSYICDEQRIPIFVAKNGSPIAFKKLSLIQKSKRSYELSNSESVMPKYFLVIAGLA